MAEQTEQIAIRINPPLKSFLERWGSGRAAFMKPASVARHAIEVFKAMAEELGSDWLEVERKAAAQGQTPGAYIGKLLKALLEAERKQKNGSKP